MSGDGKTFRAAAARVRVIHAMNNALQLATACAAGLLDADAYQGACYGLAVQTAKNMADDIEHNRTAEDVMALLRGAGAADAAAAAVRLDTSGPKDPDDIN